MIEDETMAMKTMATDGRHIYYHPDFVANHSINELSGVICHEVLHIAFLHMLRLNGRDHKLWNVACDFAINHIVLDSGLSLPPGVLFDEKYKDWTADKIYNDLLQNATTITLQQMGTDADGNPVWGGFSKPMNGGEEKPLSQAELSEMENEIKIKVQEAAEAAKSRGLLPGSLTGLIKAVGKSKVNWHDYIQQWVSGITPDNYTWSRPNRTFLANHRVFMPRMEMNGAGHGILSIDTSGSVSDKELIADVTEITGVIDLCQPETLKIVQHDAVIHSVTDLESS